MDGIIYGYQGGRVLHFESCLSSHSQNNPSNFSNIGLVMLKDD